MNFPDLPANLRLRSAVPEDDAFLAVLYRSSRPDLQAMDSEPQLLEHMLAMQRRVQVEGYRTAFPAADFLVLERCGEKIGRLVINLGSGELRLIDIALLPQMQGQAHGKAVLHSLQELASAHRVPLRLAVNAANHRAKRLYLAHGLCVEYADGFLERMVWHPLPA